MKKIISFFCLGFFASLTVSSQALKIIKIGGANVLNDSTVIVSGLASASEFSSPNFVIVNTTDSSMKVYAKRFPTSVLPSTLNEICWAGYCYANTVSVSPYYETIGPGDTSTIASPFTGDYFPSGQVGTSTIQYTFFDITDTSSAGKSSFKISYVTTVAGIAQVSAGQIKFSAPYPNPADNMVSFSYSLANGAQNGNLKIFNLLGECVQIIPLSATKNNALINVRSMPSGVYVCQIEANGCLPAIQRLVVSH